MIYNNINNVYSLDDTALREIWKALLIAHNYNRTFNKNETTLRNDHTL
jgi:hypothetical protein